MTDPKRKGRTPRPPMLLSTNLPATFEQEQGAALDRFYGMVAPAFGSQASRELMQNHLVRLLRTGNGFNTAEIIRMADAGHAPAFEALRFAVVTYLHEGGKWDRLTLQVQAWHLRMTALQPTRRATRAAGIWRSTPSPAT